MSPLAQPGLVPTPTRSQAYGMAGGVAHGDELATLLRSHTAQATSLVAHWIADNTAVSWQDASGWTLPLFQIDLPRATLRQGMAQVMHELRGLLDDDEVVAWFVRPNGWLGGQLPALALATQAAAVVNAARADRYVASGP
jgi:UDP-2,3-diacylglucosamine pyrophosphatase LpxH